MRLIDADALKEKAIRVSTVALPHTFFKAVGTREIDKAPTIDAKPVVHGEWAQVRKGVFGVAVCSNCKCDGFIEYNFCPNCGADMRERKDDE